MHHARTDFSSWQSKYCIYNAIFLLQLFASQYLCKMITFILINAFFQTIYCKYTPMVKIYFVFEYDLCNFNFILSTQVEILFILSSSIVVYIIHHTFLVLVLLPKSNKKFRNTGRQLIHNLNYSLTTDFKLVFIQSV